MKEILDAIEKRFEEGLKAKTSWGRNEVMQLYTRVQLDVMKENFDKFHSHDKALDVSG